MYIDNSALTFIVGVLLLAETRVTVLSYISLARRGRSNTRSLHLRPIPAQKDCRHSGTDAHLDAAQLALLVVGTVVRLDSEALPTAT